MRALFDYEARTDEELPLKEGDILLVTEDTDQDWWMAVEKPKDTSQEIRSGLIPASYVEEVNIKTCFNQSMTNNQRM